MSSDTPMIIESSVPVTLKTFVPVPAPSVERSPSLSPPPPRRSSPPARHSPPPEHRNAIAAPQIDRRNPVPMSPPTYHTIAPSVPRPVSPPQVLPVMPPAAPVVFPTSVAAPIVSDDSFSGLSQPFDSAPSSIAPGDKTSFAGIFKSSGMSFYS